MINIASCFGNSVGQQNHLSIATVACFMWWQREIMEQLKLSLIKTRRVFQKRQSSL